MNGKWKVFLWLMAWLMSSGMNVSAQTFRRVVYEDELKPGDCYVLAGYCEITPDSVFVIARQDETGEDVTSRAGRKLLPDENGCLHVEDGDVAFFELVEEGDAYALRDVTLDAWLAYTADEVKRYSSKLYTMTDEELAKASTTYYKTFEIQKERKGFFWTTEKIETVTGSKEKLSLLSDGITGDFKLFRDGKISDGDSLFIYKKVEEAPSVDKVAEDWTFHGDWQADSLYSLDYTEARRIDFTAIVLPQGRQMVDEGRLPEDYVWTYVRKGEAGRLPAGWPNVVEIGRKNATVQGAAATPIKGDDRCVWGPKYTFEILEGTGIDWYRTVKADDGWYTAGLPFSVQAVTWDTGEGEPLSLQRMEFDRFTEMEIVFRLMEEDEPWAAGEPVLWRLEKPHEGTVCFHADEVTVFAADTIPDDAPDGFYAVPVRMEIGDVEQDWFQLDVSGTRFVRLASGSWMAFGRGILKYTQGDGPSVRLLDSASTGVKSVTGTKEDTFIPVYTLEGRKQGDVRIGEPLPADWPHGIYVTPQGKVLR